MTDRIWRHEHGEAHRWDRNGHQPPGLSTSDTAAQPVDDHEADAAVRIVLIDDHELFRQGLVRILDAENDLNVVGEASGGSEAISVSRRHRPDVILLGSESSGIRVGEEVRSLRQAAPQAKVVVLAAHDEPRRVRNVLSAGAQAYVTKGASQDELITTIRVVHRHNDRVMLSVSRATLNTLKGSQGLMLSERELEVLMLVAEGMRNSQIAAKLYITEGTVKRHLTNIYAKLGATSRTDAVRRAASQGIGL
jgi:DNA-binding NarL/FixJ family response regulator